MSTLREGQRASRKGRKARAFLALCPLSLVLAGAGCSWDQLNPAGAVPPSAGPQDSVVLRGEGVEEAKPIATGGGGEMAAAREMFRQKEYGRAEKIFHRVAESGVEKKDLWDELFSVRKKRDVSAALAEEARYHEAECCYLQQNYPRAADTYMRLLNDFGAGQYREQACQRLFDIANFWLEDTREQMRLAKEVEEGKRWIVVPAVFHLEKAKPFFDREGRALEVLEAVRYNDISGPLADKALFLLGSVNFFNENYREADHNFTQLVEQHPNSPFAAQATELAIIAKHMSTGGSDYDGRKVAEARALVHKAQMNYPQLTRDPDKREFLERQLVGITMQQAEKDYKTAEFYRRTGKPCPAYFMYEVVRRRYPGTKYADLATERMHELKAKVEQENGGKLPVPPAGGPPPNPAPNPDAPPRLLPDLGQR